MNLLTLLLQTTDTLVTPPVLTPTVETAGDLNLWELACKGGIIMIPLLLLSLLSIYIFSKGCKSSDEPHAKTIRLWNGSKTISTKAT